jgi:hypothetical protein
MVKRIRQDSSEDLLKIVDRMLATALPDRFETSLAVATSLAPHALGSDLSTLLAAARRPRAVETLKDVLPEPSETWPFPRSHSLILIALLLLALLIIVAIWITL